MRLALVFVLLCAVASRADPLPKPFPYRDAGDVALVVEVRLLGDDRVRVTSVLHTAAPLGAGFGELRVQSLAALGRQVDPRDPDASAGHVLDATDAFLLLEFDDTTSSWKPYRTALGATGNGSSGVFWVRDGKVWTYEQADDAAPLRLVPWRPDGKTQGSVELLRKDLADGTAALRAWRADLAEPDLDARARRLARWLPRSTSPDGDRLSRRRSQVREALRGTGVAMVPPLVEILESTDDDIAREHALLALGDLGPLAHGAVPALLALVEKPGDVSAASLAQTLHAIGNDPAVRGLQKLFDAARLDDARTLDLAADTLVTLRVPGIADGLYRKLPAKLDLSTPMPGVLVVLSHLHAVDHLRAQAWLSTRAGDPLFDGDRDEVTRILTTQSDGKPLGRR